MTGRHGRLELDSLVYFLSFFKIVFASLVSNPGSLLCPWISPLPSLWLSFLKCKGCCEDKVVSVYNSTRCTEGHPEMPTRSSDGGTRGSRCSHGCFCGNNSIDDVIFLIPPASASTSSFVVHTEIKMNSCHFDHLPTSEGELWASAVFALHFRSMSASLKICLFILERERENGGEGQRGRENLKQILNTEHEA